MPLNLNATNSIKFPEPQTLTLSNYSRGVITLVDQSNLPKNAAHEMTNLWLAEQGAVATRPGMNWYGSAIQSDFLTPLTNAVFWATVGGTTPWTNGGNAIVADGAYASIGTGAIAQFLTLTTFNFAIPAQATVYGIEVQILGYSDDPSTPLTRTVKVSTTLSGSTSQTAVMPFVTPGTVSVGSGTDLWQTAPAPSDINDPNFGVRVTLPSGVSGATSGKKIFIDQIRVRVHYGFSYGMEGFDYYESGGVGHLLAAVGGTIYRSTDDGVTWTACTGATYTPGHTVNFNQNNSGGAAGVYITTGVDPIMVYTGSTTLLTYAALATPAAPAIAKTGLAGTQYTYYYKISLVNKLGYSASSPAATIGADRPRTSWDKTSNYVTLTLAAPISNQERVDVYLSEDGVNYYYLDSVVSSAATPNTTYLDQGVAVVVPSTVAPTADTTRGPMVEELTNVGVRMMGVRDKTNRARIWYSAGSPPYGAFSGAYDGGYLDWVPGGKFFPVKVEDYRDKSGAPIATVWCDSLDGEGCILQMSMDTTSVGDITVTTPSIYKLAGSRGTSAPGSVVSVLNDYMYYNSQAFYNLGSRAQFLNLLSTDEASANIRPTVRTINPAAASGISSVYWEAKVLFSVPYGTAASNSHTIIYDTERKAWMPTAFDKGFKKFVRYSGADSKHHLLALKPGDNQLTEISTDILGDYGQAAPAVFISGLHATAGDRFEFQFTEEGEFELSGAQGNIYVDMLGIERQSGYKTIKSVVVTADSAVIGTGWDTAGWDTAVWDDTSAPVVTYSEPSLKRYFTVQKELNAIQWRVSTSTADARFVLRTLQSWGTPTQAGHPRQWRVR